MKNKGNRMLGIILICICAMLTGILLSMTADEVLSLTDPDLSHTVQVTDSAPAKTARLLAQAGIVHHPTLLAGYLRLQGGDVVLGSHTFSEAMSYRAILAELRGETVPVRRTVSVTFPEGITLPEVLDRLEQAGIGEREKFEQLAKTGDFDYPFLPPSSTVGAGRVYRLEGFLYPDTYEFFSDSDERTVLSKMLEQFGRKFDERYLARCAELGKTPDQVVTLASMIQAEGKYPDEYGRIAAVFANRLKHRNFPYLESDATVRYALLLRGEGLRQVTAADLGTESRYNTYQNPGLPPGAIANPGIDAINAALFPEKTGDYFFVTGSNGRTLFARTYAEHRANIARAKQGKGEAAA